MEKIKCLVDGIFSRSTVKPLESVFNFDKEKKQVELLTVNGEWFVVSGLRRTGKTTLVRSVCNNLDVVTIYVNIWGLRGEKKEPLVLEKIVEELKANLRKYKLLDILSSIKRIGFLGASLEIQARNRIQLEQAIVKLSQKKQVVLILDEIQEMKKETSFFKFLAALHDQTAPNLSVVFLGSLISLKDLLEKSYAKPLHGRLGDEITLFPLNTYQSKLMLKKGFEQCDVPVDDVLLIEASERLGGFPGWISHFGRIAVLNYYMNKKIDIETIFNKLIEEAKKVVYAEIANAIAERRKYKNYIEILKYLGQHGEITLTKASELINKKPNTTITYLEHLTKRGIIKKTKRRYEITDPIIRELLAKKEMEKEIKTILLELI